MTTKLRNKSNPEVPIDEIEQFLKYSASPMTGAQEIVDQIKSLALEYMSEENMEMIQHAYEYAATAHEGQTRLSGEPYIIHPLKATEILMTIQPDIHTIQTCILHDVIEDTPFTYTDIKKEFGEVVANLCEGLVKVSKVRYRGEERQIETLKKTFLAMAQDLRVIFVKIADRIHNIQTLHFHPNPEKRKRIAMETLKIYVPICRKLGLYKHQLFLENGVFKIVYPDGYRRVLDYLNKKYGKADKFIAQGKKKIEKALRGTGVENFTIKGRVKSPYRIYEKLTKKYNTTDFSKVLDVLAFRVIVESIGDCYYTLGLIHKNYNPLINKIKDYIAVPKFNNYQSLHTTVLGMFPFPVEVQIRTPRMEQIAEYGVAAHFAYSEKNSETAISDKQSKWIKQLKDLVNDYKEAEKETHEQFKTNLDIEMLKKNIFVYTPKGDVIEFPAGSTILDFAFRVHTDVGLKFKNGLINGAIKPINHVLQTGDVVSINTFKNKYTATKYWVDFLHTPTAKTKLQRHIRKQEREHYLQRGLDILNGKLENFGLPLIGHDKDKIGGYLPKEEMDRYLLALLNKQQSPLTMIRKMYPQEVAKVEKAQAEALQEKKSKRKAKKAADAGDVLITNDVVVDGLTQLPLNHCKLCHPKAGDKIVAKVDKSGIKVHRTCCSSLKTISINKLMEAHWKGEDTNVYKISLIINMSNESDNLVTLMGVFKELDLNIEHMSLNSYDNDMFSVMVESSQKNPTKISYLLNDLKNQYNFITGIKTKIS